ncbi:MAG TPA: hypothetical protein VGF37_11775 [Chthoniobacterales bacterium]|jgi:hypothetical protein
MSANIIEAVQVSPLKGGQKPRVLYPYSEVFDLKPTSGLYSGCLKNPAHLFNFLA